MAAAVAVAVVAPIGQSAYAQGEHAAHFTKCAKVCADCQLACDACFTHCLTITDGDKQHVKTAQFCVDTADCCKTCASVCARGGPLAKLMLDCCGKCCDECAAACEKMPNDKHMAACAKTCRECSKECRNMATMVAK